MANRDIPMSLTPGAIEVENDGTRPIRGADPSARPSSAGTSAEELETSSRLRVLYSYMLVSLMPALGLVLVKFSLLWGGEMNYARFLLGQNEFNFLENLSFYRMDFLVGFVVLPIIFL